MVLFFFCNYLNINKTACFCQIKEIKIIIRGSITFLILSVLPYSAINYCCKEIVLCFFSYGFFRLIVRVFIIYKCLFYIFKILKKKLFAGTVKLSFWQLKQIIFLIKYSFLVFRLLTDFINQFKIYYRLRKRFLF